MLANQTTSQPCYQGKTTSVETNGGPAALGEIFSFLQCGVQPTFGTASADGVLPLAASMDHVGSMARSVYDVALLLLRAIADPPVADWLALPDPLPAPVLGRPRGFFDRLASDDVRAMMDRVCARYAQRGATVHDVALPASFGEVNRQHRIVMTVEAAAYHQDRLRWHAEDYPPTKRGLSGVPSKARAGPHEKGHGG